MDVIRALSAQLMMYRFVSIVGAARHRKDHCRHFGCPYAVGGFRGGSFFFVDLAMLTDVTLVPTAVAQARSGLWRKPTIRCVVSQP